MLLVLRCSHWGRQPAKLSRSESHVSSRLPVSPPAPLCWQSGYQRRCHMSGHIWYLLSALRLICCPVSGSRTLYLGQHCQPRPAPVDTHGKQNQLDFSSLCGGNADISGGVPFLSVKYQRCLQPFSCCLCWQEKPALKAGELVVESTVQTLVFWPNPADEHVRAHQTWLCLCVLLNAWWDLVVANPRSCPHLQFLIGLSSWRYMSRFSLPLFLA